MKAQIVMATHNPRQDLFNRQVRSIQDQSESDWQCLVLDDASADRQSVGKVLVADPRFRLLPTTMHLGPYRAFELLLSQVDTEVPVFLCDQDDAWHPDKLRRMMTLESTAFSAMRVVDESGQVLEERFLTRHPGPRTLTPARLLLMNAASGAAMMITPAVRKAALPFPAPHLRGWHDQWIAAVAARIGSLSYIDEALVDYTRHDAQVVGSGLRSLDSNRIADYGRRLRNTGVRADLRSRTRWVVAAASRLLDLADSADAELEELAAGRLTKPLLAGLRAHDVPLARALLLTAGRA